jgi:hypothetical protein
MAFRPSFAPAPSSAGNVAPLPKPTEAELASFGLQRITARANAYVAAARSASAANGAAGAGAPVPAPSGAAALAAAIGTPALAPAATPLTEVPDPFKAGILVNVANETMKVQKANGVPGDVLDDAEPFGREYFMRERQRMINLYLDDYFAFIRMVAGRVFMSVDAMIDESYKKNPAINSLFSGIPGQFDAAAASHRSAIVPSAGLDEPAPDPEGQSIVEEEQGRREEAIGKKRKQAIKDAMPKDSKFKALMWLVQQPDISKYHLQIVNEVFANVQEHTPGHVQSPLQSGWTIMSEQFVAALDAAVAKVRDDWRPDIASHLTATSLAFSETVRSFFADVVAVHINLFKYGSGKVRIPKHVHDSYIHSLVQLRNKASAIRVDARAKGGLVMGTVDTKRRRIDYEALYRS